MQYFKAFPEKVRSNWEDGAIGKERLLSKPSMPTSQTRLAELAQRLTALDQERSAIVAEINALRSASRREGVASDATPSLRDADRSALISATIAERS